MDQATPQLAPTVGYLENGNDDDNYWMGMR